MRTVSSLYIVRGLICAWVIWIGPFTCASRAQAPAPAPAQISDIERRLSEAEKSLRTLQAAPGVTQEQKAYRDELTALQKQLRETETKLATDELGLSNYYFQLLALTLGTVLTLAGVVGALAAFLIQRVVTEKVLRTTNRQVEAKIQALVDKVEKEMNARSLYETSLARAQIFVQQSFTWYQYYEPDYQKFLRTGIVPDILRQITLARRQAQQGISTLPASAFPNDDDNRLWTTQAELTNLLVYNSTAEAICRRASGNGPSKNEVTQILLAAERCLKLSKDKQAQKRQWYELHETAAVAMIKIGDQGTRECGRDLIHDLFKGQTPGPGFAAAPKPWLLERWNEYFPEDCNKRHDLLGLGNIPRPA
jgi:hypothetical protein